MTLRPSRRASIPPPAPRRAATALIVSLDNVTKTMRETGADMKSMYRETAQGRDKVGR